MRKIDKLESDVTSKQTTLEQVMNVLYVSAALNLITNIIYYFKSRLSLIVGVEVVLNRTVVVDSD